MLVEVVLLPGVEHGAELGVEPDLSTIFDLISLLGSTLISLLLSALISLLLSTQP